MNRPTGGPTGKAPIKTVSKPPDTTKAGRTGTRALPDPAVNAHEGKSRADLYGMSAIDWEQGGREGAREYLVSKGYLAVDSDASPSLETMSLVLLRIATAQGASVIAQEATRAVAFLIGEGRRDMLADVADSLNDVAENVYRMMTRVEEQDQAPVVEGGANASSAEDLRAAAQVLTRTVEEQPRKWKH